MSSMKALAWVSIVVLGGATALLVNTETAADPHLGRESPGATSQTHRPDTAGTGAVEHKETPGTAASTTGEGTAAAVRADVPPVPEFAAPIKLPTPTRRIEHTAEAAQSRNRIQYLYGLTREQLVELNPQLRRREPREGEKLLVYEAPENGQSLSVGKAHRGRLINAIQLPDGPGYKVHYPHRAFGTHYTVNHLITLFDLMHHKFPSTHNVLVGDLSFAGGNKITPHVSHRTGRDVDIGYFHKGLTEDPYRFENVYGDNFDAERNWFMIKTLVETGDVEFIFMDWRVQLMMRKHARSQGVSEEELDALFQYPAKGPKPHAVIRHVDPTP